MSQAQFEAPAQRLNLERAEVWYWPGFLPPAAADALFGLLYQDLHWSTGSVRIAGRELPMPRRIAWLAADDVRYRYSGLDTPPQSLPAELHPLHARLMTVTGTAFNGVLANLYRDGRDSMGWHSDDEAELGPRPLIASISLGAVRRFHLRPRQRGAGDTVALDLEPGSLLLMAGETQRHWRHQVPKTRRPVGARINLTWRRIGRPPGRPKRDRSAQT